MSKFIGRTQELNLLGELLKKKSSSFVIIKGRRRIGKTRLLEEFGKRFKQCYIFRGIAPTKDTTRQSQLDEFSRQLSENFKTAKAKYEDWGDVLFALSERVGEKSTLLVFDEISWMGSESSDFLAKIKDAWDTHFKKHTKLVFAVCGSASSWIEKNIMNYTGFVGRISLSLTLNELPLFECREFWPKNISNFEILKMLLVTGGVPRYLEEVNPKHTAEDNIARLCFSKTGLLRDEFRQIFSDTFLRSSDYYVRILHSLAKGSKELKEMQAELNMESSGRLSEYLWELELNGFISRDYVWNLKSGEDSKLSKYRLKDNYIRFYLRYIQKNLNKIDRGAYVFKAMTSLSHWHSILGLQFENIVLSNRVSVHSALRIDAHDIISANPYFQRQTKQKQGCQIDYLIQTKFNTLYVCEIKFSNSPIGISVIEEVEAKIAALKLPKNISCRPVLIYMNDITSELKESDYFSNYIDANVLFG